jgi:hypothetical protein
MRVRVEASDDLARWTTLVADAPVLRLQAGGQRLEQLRLEFPPRQAKYLRLSWPGSPRPLPLAGLIGEPGDVLVEAPRLWKQVAAIAPPGKPGEYVFRPRRPVSGGPSAPAPAAAQYRGRGRNSFPSTGQRRVAARPADYGVSPGAGQPGDSQSGSRGGDGERSPLAAARRSARRWARCEHAPTGRGLGESARPTGSGGQWASLCWASVACKAAAERSRSDRRARRG